MQTCLLIMLEFMLSVTFTARVLQSIVSSSSATSPTISTHTPKKEAADHSVFP